MKSHSKLLTLTALLLLLAIAKPSFAQYATENRNPNLKLEKNDDNYYIIDTDADYEIFRQIVATGNQYANAVLTSDITVTKPIGGGDEHLHYRGTFDGQNHTINVDMSNDNVNHPWGLFQFTEPGCVIKNLKVTGVMYSDHEYLGSIVGEAKGTRLENIVSDVTLFSNSTEPTGGLIGGCHGVNFIENCAYIGRISAQKACGLIGHVVHNVEIKSCYVDAAFKYPDNSYRFIDKDNAAQIFLNNYYHQNNLYHAEEYNILRADKFNAEVITDEQLMKGELCVSLNVNGRNGVVWYQHEEETDVDGNVTRSHPYPFKGAHGQMISRTEQGNYISYTSCAYTKYNKDHICQNCGKIESEYTIAPLDEIRESLNGYLISINNLKFKINRDKDLNTAELRGYFNPGNNEDAVTAIHIPESIIVDGKVYYIDYVAPDAFKDSKMEFCYISKSVNHIMHNAFNNCKQLKHLHIADGPSNGERLRTEYKNTESSEKGLFNDAPLEDVYLGRDLRWKVGSYGHDTAPFASQFKLKKIYFGPYITRLGNYDATPEVDVNNYAQAAFLYCSFVEKVYFMGNEDSYNKGVPVPVEIACAIGYKEDCYDFYINRNLTGSYVNMAMDRTTGYTGILDRCEHVTFGPFATTVRSGAFRGAIDQSNVGGVQKRKPTPLQTVNFDNAFNLRTIEDKAFEFCSLEKLEIPATVTSLGKNAFNDCPKLKDVYLLDGSAPLTVNSGTFSADTLSHFYVGRTIQGDISPLNYCKKCRLEVGPGMTDFNNTLLTGYFSSISFLYSPLPLLFNEYSNTCPETLFLDRVIMHRDSETSEYTEALPFEKTDYTLPKLKYINFGNNITSISANMFEGYKSPKTLIIPANIKTIGKNAFKGCSNVDVVSVLGTPDVNESAFANMTNLKYLYLMGSTIHLNDYVFTGCNNLKEVFTGFYEDPGNSSEKAFDEKAYSSSVLSCAGDQDIRQGGLELTSEPWVRWSMNGKQQPLVTTDIFSYTGEQKNESGLYDRAELSHNFTAKEMELVYMPFDVDSYFFGFDAEIYCLDLDKRGVPSNTFGNEYVERERDLAFDTYNVGFRKVDIDNVEQFYEGNIYLVKLKDHDENYLSGHYSLFDQPGISIQDKMMTCIPKEDTPDLSTIKCGMWHEPAKLDPEHKYYTSEDGVLKLINGDYPIDISSVVFDGTKMSRTYNLKGDGKVLITSADRLPFNEHLEGYSTFYAADYNYVAPEWCKVYIITSAQAGEEVELTEITDRTITQGQAVLLKSENDATMEGGLSEYMTYATHGSKCSFDGNLLKGVEKDQYVRDLGRDFIYVLGCNDQYQNTGFYKFASYKMMTKGKAYLDPESLSPTALAKSCLFVCNDNTTGIHPAQTADAMQGIYDLMGRRLKNAGYKGIYILNGKKVVIK